MKLRKINILPLIFLLAMTMAEAQTSKPTGFEDMAETMKIMTNQDLYFAGDKVWFGMKLLKNHHNYKYSKLSYVEIYDPENTMIHREMLLLDDKEMAYGDFILPDNLEPGEYKIFAYSQWMTNFPSYRIPQKSILVTQLGQDHELKEGQLYYTTKGGDMAELTVFHTFETPLVIEVEELDGTGKLVLEEIAPFEMKDTKVIFETPKRLKFGKQTITIQPEKVNFDPSRFSLSMIEKNTQATYLVTHTDLMVIDTLKKADFLENKLALKRENYTRYPEFQISIFDKDDKLLGHQHFNLEGQNNLQVNVSRSVATGNKSSAVIKDEDAQFGHAFAWVKRPELPEVEKLAQVINGPQWHLAERKQDLKQNYLLSRKEIEQNANPEKQKDYLPLLHYNPLKTSLKSLRPDLFTSSSGVNLPMIEDYEDFEIKRRVFHEHFEYDTRVSVPVSPYRVDFSYLVPDYEGYRDMETFLKEIVPQVRIRADKDGNTEIRMFNPNMDKVHFKNLPLLMIDLHRVDDPDFLLNYDYAQIERVEVIFLRNTIDETNLGSKAENGVLALFTKQNDYKIKHNPDASKYILRELEVSRIPAGNVPHLEANSNVALSKPQSWNPSIRLTRGRSRINFQSLEEPGKLQVEAYFFNNANWGRKFNQVNVN
ncbi:hypothetical protein KIH41_12770 [Litoribacter ruber]|uniref:hypothetical protein n=1 Tax=Litoribacter ruber TaxID=702568 RepID=UPI001BDB4F71|nr:hypothetical protein [Litoribacter ruber]MBT0812150.1 hypothetical protein [Litoribacter ruber]